MGRVLVIDDDDEVRQALRTTLEFDGHTVLAASNGAEGLRVLCEIDVDLILTDIFMPCMDGIEMIIQIRRTNTRVKIIAMCGSLDRETYLNAATAFGADAVLEKPFPITQLCSLMAQVMDREQKPREQAEASVDDARPRDDMKPTTY